MSSRKCISQNQTSVENTPIQMCHDLIEQRNFTDVHCLVNKWHAQFEKARAISDVLLAADNPLPSGLMDYYGMIRVTKGGPVLREDFMKLIKLLDRRDNSFPLRQEAADKALLAWSLLSKPHIKAQYDLSISTSHNCGTQDGCGYISVGGSQSDGVLYGGLNCSKFHESEYNHFQSKDTSFILKKLNVHPGTDDEVVIISDDEDDDDDNDEDDDDGCQYTIKQETNEKSITSNGLSH